MSTGIFDESQRTLFSVDSFGAILPSPWRSSMRCPTTSWWAAWWPGRPSTRRGCTSTDRDRLAGVLDGVRRLAPEQILSSHLPPALGRLDAFLDVMATIPDAEPFVAPDAATFDAIVAGLGAAGPG